MADRLTISKPSFCTLQSPIFWCHGLCGADSSVGCVVLSAVLGATGCQVARLLPFFLVFWVLPKKNGYALYETHPKGKGALNPSMPGMCMVHFLAFKIDCELDPQWQEAYGQESRPLHTCPCVFSVNR